ncbi:hypothetical protein NRIC_04000 [Enterococcus florum]|uniref:Uncharacterized protein n=1 Tax=Enterococcus florum TaxID=2480627 RepID=A0A4V0WP38_9ENTE|nr:hypothetical protein [Enterococcus florum]GCF92509.1 hypothetical protein NRIC_04000 [Enterococcus florum]
MMAEKCSACSRLEETSLSTVEYGIGDKECKSLQNNTGLNPDLKEKHDDCQDLNDMNDCLIGNLGERLPAYDDCDYKPFIGHLMGNLWNMFKGIICAICGIWKKLKELEELLIKDGYIAVTKNYEFTVPEKKFYRISSLNERGMWFSGSPQGGECFISIPVAEMDIVECVLAQPQVVGDRVHAVTCAIQENYREGDNYIVNFDTYIIEGETLDGVPGRSAPFPVPIEFVVIGRKKVK